MTETLQRLQDRLSAADRCYRRPTSLDFLPHASAERPLLATTSRNANILTYQATLRILKMDADRLAASTRHWPLRQCLRVALLQANIATRLMTLDGHIVSALSRSPCAQRPTSRIITPVASRNVDLPSRDLSAPPIALFGSAETRDYRDQSLLPQTIDQIGPPAPSSPSVPIINAPSEVDFLNLNRQYSFFSISLETALRHPPASRYGFPRYIRSDLQDYLNKFHHWTKTSLVQLADAHNVSMPSTSRTYFTKDHYHAALLEHRCTDRCSSLVLCFTHLANPRSISRQPAINPDPNINETRTRPATLASMFRSPGLHPPSTQLKHEIIREWQDAMSTENQKPAVCACCSRRFKAVDLKRYAVASIDFTLLQNNELPSHVLPTNYDFEGYDRALLDPKGLTNPHHKSGLVTLCKECNTSITQKKMPKYSLANWLYYGHDRLPSNVASAFKSASVFERSLIARARSNRITFRYCHKPDSPQYGWNYQTSQSYSKGNVMVMPQDSLSLTNVLPPPPEVVRDSMAVLLVGSNVTPTKENLKTLHPCLVRKSRVATLINFLIRHNQYYRLDSSFSGLSTSNLDALAEPGSNVSQDEDFIPASLEIAHLDPNDQPGEVEITADYTNRNEADAMDIDQPAGDLLLENVGYTLGDTSPVNYNLMKLRALEHCLDGEPFVQSRQGNIAEKDFENERLLSWLFPHLDPWGIGGFHHPARKEKLTLLQQLSCMVSRDDPIFARDPLFAFVYFNIHLKKSLVRDCMFRVKESQYATVIDELRSSPPDLIQRMERKFQINPLYRTEIPEEQRILQLLSRLQCVNYKLPGSNGYKKGMRNEIRSLIYRYGTPALFITINPNDVNNPLVRLIVGDDINLEDASTGETLSKFLRHKLAADNPHATADYFDRVINAFINTVLRYNRDEPGLFGKCTAYYGTVEAQGKGTLHCHFLIWLDGHLSPQTLRDRLTADPDFKQNLFAYLESIIKSELPGSTDVTREESGVVLEPPERSDDIPNPAAVPLPQSRSMSSVEFERQYSKTVSDLVIENHWHRHNATCWKYLGRGEPRDDSHCRMRIDGTVQASTTYDEESNTILLRRLHPRINCHNDVLTFLTQSNNDIKFIGTGEDAKALVYYITDYITKASLPTHIGLSALRVAIENNKKKYDSDIHMDAPDNEVRKSLFVKCANTILGRQEISHPQVMSYLIGGGDHYTGHKFELLVWTPFDRVIQKFFNSPLRPGLHDEDAPSDPLDPETMDHFHDELLNPNIGDELDDHVTVHFGPDGFEKSALYYDYIYRPNGEPFSGTCLYEFVQNFYRTSANKSDRGQTLNSSNIGRRRNARGAFLEGHPSVDKCVLMQRSREVIPTILGPTIVNPDKSEHARDNWARIMLILFKPWRNPLDLKHVTQAWTTAFSDWTFSDFHRQIMDNILILDQCKDARNTQSASRRLVTSMSGNSNPILAGEEDLLAALVVDQALDMVAADISSVAEDDDAEPRGLSEMVSSVFGTRLDRDPSINVEGFADSGRLLFHDNDKKTLEEHTSLMRSLKRSKRPLAAIADSEDSEHLSNDGELVLHSENPSRGETTIATVELDAYPANSDASSAEIPNRLSLEDAFSQVVTEYNLSGNEEQLRVIRILVNHLANPAHQLLMYVGGVGGTGKSHVIKAIVRLLQLQRKKDQIILSAPTGAAAVLIGGATIHSVTLPFNRSVDLETLTKYWQQINFLIIDEVSMIGAYLLSRISSRLNQAKGLQSGVDRHQFGGINMILLGDFGQLKPVGDYSLFDYKLLGKYAAPRIANSPDGQAAIQGIGAWRQVDTVVLLQKNQRQQDDPVYAQLLARIRIGQAITSVPDSTTPTDVSVLRTRLVPALLQENEHLLEQFGDAPVIVGSKQIRDIFNWAFLHKAAERLGEQVHIYHSTDKLHGSALDQETQSWAWRLRSSTTEDSLGRLPLFRGMKVMITENVAISNKLVNGADGVVDSILYDIDEHDRRYAKICYVRVPGSSLNIPGLDPDVAPIIPTPNSFPFKRRFTISRSQLPLLPCYSYTDYKSQGRTLSHAFVDLMSARTLQGAYVMLSRVKCLEGLGIIRDFDNHTVEQRLSPEMRAELLRLEELDKSTRVRDLMARQASDTSDMLI